MAALTDVRPLLYIALVGGISSCGERVTEQQCSALLDRYVEQLADQNSFGENKKEAPRLKREASELARRDPSFQKCPHEVSRAQWDCAMQAPNADRLEQCLLW